MQPKLSGDSFLTEPEGEETAKVRVDRSGGYVEQLEERVLTLERERKQRMFAHEVVFVQLLLLISYSLFLLRIIMSRAGNDGE